MNDSGTTFLDSLIIEQSTPAVATVVNEAISFSGDRVKTNTPAGKELVEKEHLCQVLLQHPTEDSVALAYRTAYRDREIYMHGKGCWFDWTGELWAEDTCKRHYDKIRNLARSANLKGHAVPAKASFVAGVDTHLRYDPAFSRHVSSFDVDTNLLNTPAGTIDLRMQVTKPHLPGDCITQITNVAPSSTGGRRFSVFLDEITDGDNGLKLFHQCSLGSILSGATEEHWLLFWFGAKSRNGKNTFGDLVVWILGSYAGVMPTSALMQKSNDSHPTEMMNLKGKRLVVSSEVPEGCFWNESRLKETTGDSTLQGHYMRQDWIEFPRTHKHLIYGNHKPQLRNIDMAIQARFKLVPFPVSFVGREDPDLPAKLRAEAPFILHWLLEGHRIWRENCKRLVKCAAVEKASTEYFASQSTLEMWIEERCEILTSSENIAWSNCAKSSELYADFSEWKKKRGEVPPSHTRWGAQMGEKFQCGKSDGVRYRGLRLKHRFPGAG